MTENSRHDRHLPLAGEKGIGYEDLPLRDTPRDFPPMISGKAFVAWLDVLGFKEFLRSRSLGGIVRTMRELDGIVEYETDRIGSAAQAVYQRDGSYQRGYCETVRFSDTFLIYSTDSTGAGLSRVVRASLATMGNLLIRGIPVRGAIAGGDVYIDPAAMFFAGEPILAAYEWSEKQEWAGAILVPDLENDPSIAPAIRFLETQKMLISYRAPMKKDSVRDFFCLNWTLNYPLGPEAIHTFWRPHSRIEDGALEDWKPEVLRKADATVEFAKWVRTDH